MDDEKKLKLLFNTILGLSVLAVIGIWEFFVKPILIFIISIVFPFLASAWSIFMGQ